MRPALPSRRSILHAGLAAGAAGLVPCVAEAQSPTTQPALRFVHMTDMHVQPELRGGEGFAAALESIQKLAP